MDEGKVPGFVTLIARRGQIVHFERFGRMDVEADKPMQLDAIFRLYSMTKPITSVAVMMLYEEGHFQLRDPIANFIPELKDVKVFVRATESGPELADLERPITILDLLTHTSGLSHSLSDQPVDKLYAEALKQLGPQTTLTEVVKMLARQPLATQPGKVWRYSFAPEVLGRLVEVISGLSFETFLEERIFRPLGMADTGFYVPQDKVGRFATLYGQDKAGSLRPLVPPAAGMAFFTPGWPQFPAGFGGLVSTATDYWRFAQMLLNGGCWEGEHLLGRETVELMTTNYLPAALLPFQLPGLPNFGMGKGFGLGVQVVMSAAEVGRLGSEGSFGWGGAASTYFVVDPKEGLIGLIMAQLIGWPYPTFEQFEVLTYQALVD